MTTKREEILDKAKACVIRDRNSSYGEPEDNFRETADLWNMYMSAKLKEKITPFEVAMLMMLLKVARTKTSPDKDDHLIDICGYAACAAGVSGRFKAPTPAMYGLLTEESN